MMSTSTLLAPVAQLSDATTVLSVARGLAPSMGATVVLLHVGESSALNELRNDVRLSREDARGLIVEHRSGSPADAIVSEAVARHAELIVMRTPRQPDRLLLLSGSVGGDVLRAAPCPVVLVPRTRGGEPWSLRHLVLPHDGTPTSGAAIAPTARLASRAGADLVVLHVSTPGSKRPTEPGTFITPHYFDQPQHGWSLWTREFLDRVRAFGYPASIEHIRLVVAHGEPGAAILDFARRNTTDLIALAWRGGLAPDRARTIREVVREARCPVIVFRVLT
jgi:nucleotide-binding universal stress UspA family protein